jgi:hypothetical protein
VKPKIPDSQTKTHSIPHSFVPNHFVETIVARLCLDQLNWNGLYWLNYNRYNKNFKLW